MTRWLTMCDADVLPLELQNHFEQCRHCESVNYVTDRLTTYLDNALGAVDTAVTVAMSVFR